MRTWEWRHEHWRYQTAPRFDIMSQSGVSEACSAAATRKRATRRNGESDFYTQLNINMRLIKSKTFGGFKSASALHLLRNLLHITSMQSTRRCTATFVLPFPPVLEWTSTNMIETPSPGDGQQALIQTTSEALRKHKSSWWFCRHSGATQRCSTTCENWHTWC